MIIHVHPIDYLNRTLAHTLCELTGKEIIFNQDEGIYLSPKCKANQLPGFSYVYYSFNEFSAPRKPNCFRFSIPNPGTGPIEPKIYRQALDVIDKKFPDITIFVWE